ncbi:hypothetical protein ASPFODRAFT_555114 [Aspergillus luchuensis CBS 106.47]|uniref:CHAT domain-containing protein n=1 Tax=Aspergillus luchuensis (strain CBS 106.47) TaxID=1137211 RepID=A0A1M3SYY6_ASPLC|nr:hypothetical protein ASPFODRAFT_555114 [Aspergillus luchuensis CBS 106.47]
MDSASTQVRIDFVERSYSPAKQEWVVDVRNSLGQVIGTVNVKNPLEDEDEENIRWYLEEHVLSDPYQIRRAKEAVALLDHYRNELAQIFQATVKEAISSSSASDLRSIRLDVVSRQSSTSKFQSLHWELLESADWDIGMDVIFILTRRITLSQIEFVAPILDPQKDIHILFISARPAADRDIDYRLISRPLVDLVNSPQMQGHCDIDFVRPGSWLFFESYLHSHPPGYYSIVHFDVHGLIYMDEPHLKFTPLIPKLLFDVQKASTIAEQLKKTEVKTVILNACNSANAQTSYHSNLAQIFVEAGVSTVIAMSYAVLAESAELFVSQFYESFLYQRLDADLASHAARRAMETSSHRQGAFGLMRTLKDCVIPVVYKGHSGSLSWEAKYTSKLKLPVLSHHAVDTKAFVGRDIDILKLEQLLFWKHAIYLYGPGGSGKTSLARHLSYWWVKTHFFDNTYITSSRDFQSFDESAIYRSLAALIRGHQSSSAGYVGDQTAREIVHQSSCVIFIDDCETTAGKIGLEHFVLPALDQEAASNLQTFLTNFCAVKEVKCRLVLLSRTDALMADHIIDPDGRVANEHIGYYELKNMRSTDIIQIVKSLEGSDSKMRDLSDTDVKQLSDLFKFHDNNVMVALLLAPCIRQSESGATSIESLDETLQTQLPGPLSESILGRLEAASQEDVGIFSDFAMVMADLKSSHPVVHRTMLCFAVIRSRCLNFVNLSGYLLNLAGWRLLPSCPGAEAYRLSQPIGRRAASLPERYHYEVFDHSPSTRHALRDAMKILKVIGLVEEDVALASQSYYKLHPLLPYLLRAEILRLDDSVQFMHRLNDSFLDYWNFRASEWVHEEDSIIPGFIVTEWPNLCSAIDLCVQHRGFDLGDIEMFGALKHVLKAGGRTPEKIEKSLKLLIKAIFRFERVAALSVHSALAPDMISKATGLIRLMLQFLKLSNRDVADEGALSLIRRSMSLLETSKSAYGALDSESWCTGIALELAMLRNKAFTEESHECVLYSRIWNATIPVDASDELAAFFYDTQFHLLLLLLDERHLMESFAVTEDMIRNKAEAILDAMKAEDLDSTSLELIWSMFQLKHLMNTSDTPFDLDGAPEATNIIQMVQQRGIGLDENDPNVAMILAIASRQDPERARSILLKALHHAHQQNDRRAQQVLHRALFMVAMENYDLEHSVLHFDEMQIL